MRTRSRTIRGRSSTGSGAGAGSGRSCTAEPTRETGGLIQSSSSSSSGGGAALRVAARVSSGGGAGVAEAWAGAAWAAEAWVAEAWVAEAWVAPWAALAAPTGVAPPAMTLLTALGSRTSRNTSPQVGQARAPGTSTGSEEPFPLRAWLRSGSGSGST